MEITKKWVLGIFSLIMAVLVWYALLKAGLVVAIVVGIIALLLVGVAVGLDRFDRNQGS